MAAQRSSNAVKHTAHSTHQVKNDLIGVLLSILSIAMFLALFVPSDALITTAASTALTMCFGAGAWLVPLALLVFSSTYFIEREQTFSWRIAAGLVTIVLAIMAMLSLNIPGAEHTPLSLFYPLELKAAGGYVGSGIAYALITLVGVAIGNVILIGACISGVIICGFSISALVTKLRITLGDAKRVAEEHAQMRREERERKRAQLEAERERQARLAAQSPEPLAAAATGKGKGRGRATQAVLFDETGSAQTTYLGDRKTSVLKRDVSEGTSTDTAVADAEADAPAPAPMTLTHDILNDAEDPIFKGKKKRKATKRTLKDQSATAETGAPSDEPATAAGAAVTMGATAAGAVATPAASHTPELPFDTNDLQSAGPQNKTQAQPQAPQALERPGDAFESYTLPPFSILKTNPQAAVSAATEEELQEMAQRLQATLEEFKSTSKVVGWTTGPSVTTFQISMGEGERVSKITNLEDDIALSLAARSVRIYAPIPGTSYVGIEIPNKESMPVNLGDVLMFAKNGPLECAFGRDSSGRPIVVDLAELPHLLVAGTTGSGKSVLLNSLIMSILMRATPEQVRFIMVDPKRVEFAGYAGLPHLYVPVVTEPRQAASALQWAVTEMERRLKVFNHYGVREIKVYNKQIEGGKFADLDNPPDMMPYFVIVIDELADLMMVAGKDVEQSIIRIAQLGRAAGIHLIVATQRPSADVVTGLIRANIDNRAALSVDTKLNSRIILDSSGAEQLLGHGDMLVKRRGRKLVRAQGCWVSDEEIRACVEHIRNQVTAEYHEDILTQVQPTTPNNASTGGYGDPDREDDPLIWEAAQCVVDSQLGSTSGLQRALSVGYARAGRIMDMLEAKGVVGPANGTKPRDVLISKDDLEDLKLADAQYREV